MLDREEFYRALGSALRDARRSARLSQASVGEKLNPPLTRAAIANIEKGKQRVYVDTLVQLSRVFERAIADFVSTEGVPMARWVPDNELAAELAKKIPGLPPSRVAKLANIRRVTRAR